jgi:hypothetical protein
MIKRIIVFIIIILLFTVLGASNPDIIRQNFTFFGENDSWSAVYTVNNMGWFSQTSRGLHYDTGGTNMLTITYKKDFSNLSSVKHFELKYETGSFLGSISGDGAGLARKTFTFKNEGGSPVREDAIFSVTINLDENVQTIILKNNALD